MFHPGMVTTSCFTKLLENFSQGLNSRRIYLQNNITNWQIYYDREQLIYATNTLRSQERLERHLKRISRGNYPGLKPLQGWMRSHLETFFEADSPEGIPPDYQSIHWLVTQDVLPPDVAILVMERITLEVLETALIWNDHDWHYRVEILGSTDMIPIYKCFELPQTLSQLYERLRHWQNLKLIRSPYQRPYFSSSTQALRRVSPETMEKLTRLLKGFNFRQLSALVNQDELVIAQRLCPLVEEGVIILREPEPPFEHIHYGFKLENTLLDNTGDKSLISSRSKSKFTSSPIPPNVPVIEEDVSHQNLAKTQSLASKGLAELGGELSGMVSSVSTQQVWKVVCVDDSEAMLQEITRLLDSESLSITTISDPTKALMKICTLVPDIVLLDVGMPDIDGYQICQLIRKVPRLKDIPIVMVTGNKGLVDRAKARLAGATDYLTKPFDQQDLIAMVFRYLS